MTDTPDESRRPSAVQEGEQAREEARVARARVESLITDCARGMAELEKSLLGHEARRSAVNDSRVAVKNGVCELAQCLRGLGAPPERALTIVKEIAENAMRGVEAAPRFVQAVEARELRADVVRWTITAYFGSSARTKPAPQ